MKSVRQPSSFYSLKLLPTGKSNNDAGHADKHTTPHRESQWPQRDTKPPERERERDNLVRDRKLMDGSVNNNGINEVNCPVDERHNIMFLFFLHFELERCV